MVKIVFQNRISFILIICCFIFILMDGKEMKSQTINKSNYNTKVMHEALKDFCGDDLSVKKGRLVKADFNLVMLLEEYKNHTLTQPLVPFQSNNSLLQMKDNKVIVDIIGVKDISQLKTELIKSGMQITGIAGPIISGLIPISSIEQIAGLQNVRFFRPSVCSLNKGLITSQGDISMQSDIEKNTLGYTGTGVTIGVLSDSYNYLGGASADVLSGDLPGAGNPDGFTNPINVLADDGTTDEGRAMLQIIHDVAPGASLAFATAYSGQAGFANNITNLRTTAGAKIIVDDVYYYYEPMFQDGVIAQAVDSAVSAGVSYFSAAGNEGQNSYESSWRSGTVLAAGTIAGAYPFLGGTTFDFDPGPGVDYLQGFTLNGGKTVIIVLQWDSPCASVCTGCPGSFNDLDLYLLNSTGNYIYFSSVDNNINADPMEFIWVINNGSGPIDLNLMIVKKSGSDPGFIKYVNYGNAQGNLEYATNSSTIVGHANANGAEAVGAAAYYQTPAFGVNPPQIESFSSYGSTAIRFTTTGDPTFEPRNNKPEITAPDGVNTTFFGTDIPQDDDSYPNFFGTSAAAPHAAAVAALMLSANSTLTPAQIYASLEASSIDMGTQGFDNASGFGLIQADNTPPLPVELISLKTIIKSSVIELSWTTATEINNYGFEIEREETD
jgi:subtilisin family serine protease